MNPYRNWRLIQRLRRTPHGSGVIHDYMGSAEFEWGAVPASWEALRAAARDKKLVRLETPFKSNCEEPFFVICHSDDDKEYVFNGILGASTHAYPTKEATFMQEAMTPVLKTHYSQEYVGWLMLSDPDRAAYAQPCCVVQIPRCSRCRMAFNQPLRSRS